MKGLIWAGWAVLTTLWTGLAALAAGLLSWAAASLAGGGGPTLPAPPPPEAVPAWLAPWLSLADWQAWQQAAQQALAALQAALPFIGTATGWLEPLVWALWAVGAVCLLGLAVGAHALLALARRHAGPRLPAAA